MQRGSGLAASKRLPRTFGQRNRRGNRISLPGITAIVGNASTAAGEPAAHVSSRLVVERARKRAQKVDVWGINTDDVTSNAGCSWDGGCCDEGSCLCVVQP